MLCKRCNKRNAPFNLMTAIYGNGCNQYNDKSEMLKASQFFQTFKAQDCTDCPSPTPTRSYLLGTYQLQQLDSHWMVLRHRPKAPSLLEAAEKGVASPKPLGSDHEYHIIVGYVPL